MSDIRPESRAHQIIDTCIEANKRCTQAVALSLDKGDGSVSSELIRALTDCAEFSRLTADFISRASHHAHEVTALCARTANYAADVIGSLEREDVDLRACHAACRAANEACRGFGAARNGFGTDTHGEDALKARRPGADAL